LYRERFKWENVRSGQRTLAVEQGSELHVSEGVQVTVLFEYIGKDVVFLTGYGKPFVLCQE